MQYRLENKQTYKQGIFRRRKWLRKDIKVLLACQIKKDNWKYDRKTNIQHNNPKVMYTRYYLLRWHI